MHTGSVRCRHIVSYYVYVMWLLIYVSSENESLLHDHVSARQMLVFSVKATCETDDLSRPAVSRAAAQRQISGDYHERAPLTATFVLAPNTKTYRSNSESHACSCVHGRAHPLYGALTREG